MTHTHYFKAVFHLDHHWQEAKQGVVRLQSCELLAFLVFAHWINTGSIEDRSDVMDAFIRKILSEGGTYENQSLGRYAREDEIYNEAVDDELDSLIDAWRLGSYLICPSFQNAAMNEIIKRYSALVNKVPLYDICYIINNEPYSSPLRRLLIDSVRFGVSSEAFTDAAKMGIIPFAVVTELATLSLGRKPLKEIDRSTNWLIYPCEYHVRSPDLVSCPCPERSRLSAENRYDGNGNLW